MEWSEQYIDSLDETFERPSWSEQLSAESATSSKRESGFPLQVDPQSTTLMERCCTLDNIQGN